MGSSGRIKYESFPRLPCRGVARPLATNPLGCPFAWGEIAQEVDMLFRQRQRQVVEAVLARREVVVTSAVELTPGKKGFVYVPIFRDGEFGTGLLLVSSFFKSCSIPSCMKILRQSTPSPFLKTSVKCIAIRIRVESMKCLGGRN